MRMLTQIHHDLINGKYVDKTDALYLYSEYELLFKIIDNKEMAMLKVLYKGDKK